MKVLFVGEGPHDIGSGATGPDPQPAGGAVPSLTRRVCPSIRADSVALRWVQIARLSPAGKKRGFAAKVAAAVLLSARKFRCDGTVCVTDQDRDTSRLAEMQEGMARGIEAVGGSHLGACGVAVESIEAWTLGAPAAIAEELGIDRKVVEAEYPRLHVESLYQRSGKEEHRPKDLLERVARLAHRSDSREMRAAVGGRTDVRALETACPQGFKVFADKLRAAFGRCPDGCGKPACEEEPA